MADNKPEETGEKSKKKKGKRGVLKTAGRSIKLLLFLTILLLVGVLYLRYGRDVTTMYQEAKLLVKLSSNDTFRQTETSIIYDVEGNELKSLSGEKKVFYVDYKDIPQYFIDAMVSVEDRKFFKHKGIDAEGVGRAFVALIEHKGDITQGGSTITQQLAKNIFLTNELTWKRKVKEAFVSLELEKKYDKTKIMEFYLNNIYFSNGYYGIDAASKGYFQKELSDLSLSQVAFLCAIPNNPSYYDPVTNMEHTISRRNKILHDMLGEGYINELDYTRGTEEEIVLDPKVEEHINYVETYVFYSATRALMKANGFEFESGFANDYEKEAYEESYKTTYDEWYRTLFTGGYRIHTSIDVGVQEQLQESLDKGLADYEEKNDDGVYAFQGAATCINNESGMVCAVVGGRTQEEVKGYTLNRAFQSPRQPGSSIKPLNVYTPAFELGYSPEKKINVLDDNGKVKNTMEIKRAVAKSNNGVAKQIYKDLTPGRCMSYIKKMEFKFLVKSDESVEAGALGGFAYGTTTEEMAAAYFALENDGQYKAPTCITSITDSAGNVLFENSGETKTVYDKNATRMMTSVLQGVLKDGGTAEGFGLKDMHCAGKTGTTNKNYDGWFCGFTPYYTTAVWVGYDMPRELKELAGNTYPVKIWNAFMTGLHSELEDADFAEFVDTYREKETTEEESEEETETASRTEAETEEERPSETETTTKAETETETETEATTEASEEVIWPPTEATTEEPPTERPAEAETTTEVTATEASTEASTEALPQVQ